MSKRDVNFFLVGCERSGTTLLRLMLNEHPNMAMPAESHFIVNLIERFGTEHILSKNEVIEAYNIIVNLKRWQEWENSKEVLLTQLEILENPTIAKIVNVVFELKLSDSGKQIWGDKTPKYSNYIDKIHNMYPDAKFIHLTRDGRDVCLSFLKTGWIGPWVSRIAKYWSNRVEAAKSSQSYLTGTRYLEIRYEDLVSQTEATLRKICRFLDQDYSAVMLEYSGDFEKNLAGRELALHQKLKRKPKTQDINRWKKELGWWKILTFEAFAKEDLASCGYACKFKYSGVLFYPLTRWFIAMLTHTSKIRQSLGLTLSTSETINK